MSELAATESEADEERGVQGRTGAQLADLARDPQLLELAALLGLPLLVMLINDSWTFLHPSGIDPWVYTGYFFNLDKYLHVFPNTYYGSRFPWILLGSAVHSVFSPAAATLVLRLLLYYGATFSLYVVVRALWQNRTAALISAIILGTHTQFLQAIGWNNPDGAAMVCLLIAAAFLAVALSGRRWRLWLFCAGIALLTAPSVHLFVAPLALLLVLGFLINNLKRGRDWVDSILWMATGGVFAFSVYAVIHRSITGDFFYVRGQLDAAQTLNGDQIRVPVETWLPTAGYLIFPFVAAVIAIGIVGVAAASLIKQNWRDVPDGLFFAASASLQFILGFTYFIVFDLDRGATLQFDYYVSFLIAPAFVVFGGALSLCLARVPSLSRVLLPLSALLIVLLPFQFGALRFATKCSERCVSSGLTQVLVVCSLILIAGAFVWQRRKDTRTVYVASLLAIASLVPLSLINVAVGNRIVFTDTGQLELQSSLAFKADEVVRAHDADGRLRFWYDSSDAYGPVYSTVASLHLWGYRLVSEDFPKRTYPLTGEQFALLPGIDIVILSTDPGAVDKANATLAGTLVRFQVVDTRPVQQGSSGFTLTFVRVVPA